MAIEKSIDEKKNQSDEVAKDVKKEDEVTMSATDLDAMIEAKIQERLASGSSGDLITALTQSLSNVAQTNQKYEKYDELSPDLVTMDILMPGLDGLSCLKDIKAYDKNANIVICSVVGEGDIVFSAMELGALDCIAKPFDIETIIKKFKDIKSKL